MGKGAVRGGAKLTEGITTLIAAGAEKFILGPEALKKLDPEGDGIVKDIGEFYKRNVYDKIGDTETLAGGLTEGLAQFIVPGVGYYKLFNGLIKAKGMLPFITRALAAETAMLNERNRETRNELLTASDWTVLTDSPLTTSQDLINEDYLFFPQTKFLTFL